MKIGIVNDSIMASEVLRRIVNSRQEHKIVWMAENGAEAIMRCNSELPDLVLMDLLMPVMDGVEATSRIMQATPCAILVVTGSVSGNSSLVFEAMGAGALDAVATPVLGDGGSNYSGDELLRKINTIGKLIGCNDKGKKSSTAGRAAPLKVVIKERILITIGASTGGPQALTKVLGCLPKNLDACIVVVQHMDRKFTKGLTTWLNNQIPAEVKIIKVGDRPQNGVVMVPTTDHHLVLTSRGTFNYTTEPADNFYHPSVDVFFQSVAAFWHGKVIAALLTGMGRDGANGLLTLKNMGNHTIAQDQESSVVYGMPKAAVELDAASETLPLDQIGHRLLSLAG